MLRAQINEITTKASPKPNNIRPKQRKNKVDNFGFRLKVSGELHETLGIFLIVRNIYLAIIYTFFN